MRSKVLIGTAAGLTFFLAILIGALFHISDLLIFPFKPREKWTSVETIECSQWMKDWAYADLSQGGPGKQSIDISCQDSLNLPSQSFYVTNPSSEKIHYKVYDNIPSDKRELTDIMPLFLHVHGVAGTYMHGARYFKMAQRLGFQLVVMEMSNHGLSEHNSLGASYGCREQYDVIAVIDALKIQFPGRKILAHGTSMGSMALVNASAKIMSNTDEYERKILQALVLESPIPSVARLVVSSPKRPNVPQFLIDMGVWLAGVRARVDFDSCQPIDSAPAINVPTYVYNTVNDDIIHHQYSTQVADAIPAQFLFRRKVFEKGAHSAVWNGQPEEVEQDIKDLWSAALPVVPAVPAKR
jgi:predicted alpha/beta-fold hydrolase